MLPLERSLTAILNVRNNSFKLHLVIDLLIIAKVPAKLRKRSLDRYYGLRMNGSDAESYDLPFDDIEKVMILKKKLILEQVSSKNGCR